MTDQYTLPEDVRKRASEATRSGIKLKITPCELVALLDTADKALNGDSNDAEHDALYQIREVLSGTLEDPTRYIC